MLKIEWENNNDDYEPYGLNNFKTEIKEDTISWVELMEKFCVVLKVMGYEFDDDKVVTALENILQEQRGSNESDWNWNWDREEDELDKLDLFGDE
jgi:hypothetical protein